MNTAASSGRSKRSAIADTVLNSGVPLWFLLAGILAATMGMWPPHFYI